MEPVTLQLSVIVPITGPPIRIINLLRWLPHFGKLNGEVILVHDISDSDTTELLAKTISEIGNDFKLTLIEGKFGSPGAARNAGKRIAQSTWVTFWDCDDIPNLKNIKNLVDASIGTDLDFICGSFDVVNIRSESSVTTHVNSGDLTSDLKRIGLNPGVWRFIFKRSTIEELNFLEISMAEDQDFLLDYNLVGRSGQYSQLITYSYYKGQEGQLTDSKSALSDLQISISHLDIHRKTKGRNIYLEIIYLRQIMTGILRGSFRIRIFCSYKFIRAILNLRNKTSLEAFALVFSPSERRLVSNV